MSQYRTKGTDPKTGNPVDILYGYDSVPGLKPGYFVQAYDPTIEENDGLVLDLGYSDGITLEEMEKTSQEWKFNLQQVDPRNWPIPAIIFTN